MGVVKVEYDEIQNVISEMRTVLGKINTELNDIKGIVDRIESTDIWVGEANDYYNEKSKNIYTIQETVDTNINKSINYLSGAVENYKVTDAKIANK